MKRVLGAVITCLLVAGGPADAQDTRTTGERRVGDFLILTRLDNMNDEDRSIALVVNEEEEAGFAWACMSDGLNVMISLGTYYGGDSDDEIIVETRLDDQEPSGQNYWIQSTDKRSAFMPMDRVVKFTNQAKTATRVTFRATDPLDGEAKTAVFSIKGLSEALSSLPCVK